MKKVIEIFNKIQKISGKNDKENIIRRNSENELFKKCLIFLFDGNVITGISKKKLSKRIYNIIPKELNAFEEVMMYLQKNNTGKDKDILAIKNFISKQPDEEKEIYEQLVTKSLRLGIDYKTVNKAIPNLIKTYETQQAFPLSEKNKPKNNEWFSLSEKINGVNAGFMNGECISRQGKPITGMSHIIEEINKLGLGNMYINGELVRNNTDDISDGDNFQLSTSIINSDSEDKREIQFIFYEILTLEEFNRGKSDKRYKDRFEYYKEIENKIKELNLKYIRFINHFYSGNDLQQIGKWLDYADNHNMEGCMLNKNTYWENKRNNGLLKIKSFKTCDIPCIGIMEGSGKYKNVLGNIICMYKGYEVGVGSGFTDEQREYYSKNPEEIIGKIVEVKYKTETKNKDGGISIQFPTFVGLREDGKEESYN